MGDLQQVLVELERQATHITAATTTIRAHCATLESLVCQGTLFFVTTNVQHGQVELRSQQHTIVQVTSLIAAEISVCLLPSLVVTCLNVMDYVLGRAPLR